MKKTPKVASRYIPKAKAPTISDKMIQQIQELPSFVRKLYVTRTDKGKNILEIAETLKLMGTTSSGMPEAIVRSKDEFYAEFGDFEAKQHHKSYFLTQLKGHGVQKARVAAHEDKVYIWKEDVA